MTEVRQQKAETRQRILAEAGKLFRRNGVDAVGVDTVMRAAGLTHGGFYAHFRSKEALVAEVCGTLLERSADRWEAIGDHPDGLGQIVGGYLDPARLTGGHACPLATIGPDVSRREDARGSMGGALRRMIAVLTRLLPGRRQALVSLSTMVGAVVLSRLADDPALAEEILAAAKAAVLTAEAARVPD